MIAEKGLMQAAADRAAEHAAERAATTPALVFDLFVVIAAITIFIILNRFTEKLALKAIVMAGGVLVFELFTGPLWINQHLGRWAYIYCDVSWILTLGWTAMILGVVVLVDRWFSDWGEAKRFAMSLGVLLVLVTVAEMVVVGIGVRKYSPEVLATISGISVLGVPIEILYYVPVFTALVIASYKYWNFIIDDAPLVPVKKRKWLRAIGLAFLSVFLFEIVVEPMVQNEKFPAWSYIYNDISFLMTGMWVLLIAIGAVVIERFTLGLPIPVRFCAALLVISALVLPIESWLINNGYRVYGESAVMNFSGFTTPITGVAVEVAFATPCYLALIVGFIRYWEIVLDNRL